MRLEVGSFAIRRLEFGAQTALRDHTLVVNPDEIRRLVLGDPHFADVDVHLARPGESVRIVHSFDVVEPRWKVAGSGGVFPGFISLPSGTGEGRIHRLAGVAVVEAGEPVPGEPTHFREQVIDMAGPGAQYSPFGQTLNLVLHFKPNPDFFPPGSEEIKDFLFGGPAAAAYIRSMVRAGMNVAARLGRTSQDAQPDQLETFELAPCDPDLLKVVCVYHQKDIAYLYGVPMDLPVATVMHPNEFFEGVLTPCRTGLTMGTTYWEQNNEVLLELCRRHGQDLNFLGCILLGGVTAERADKERVSSSVAKLARMMGAQAALFMGMHQSNFAIDVMLSLQKCEQAGIKTTLVFWDRGYGAGDPGVIFSVPEADAVVCTGSHEQRVTLPPMEKVIGGDYLIDSDTSARGEITVPMRSVHCATDVQGFNRLTTRIV